MIARGTPWSWCRQRSVAWVGSWTHHAGMPLKAVGAVAARRAAATRQLRLSHVAAIVAVEPNDRRRGTGTTNGTMASSRVPAHRPNTVSVKTQRGVEVSLRCSRDCNRSISIESWWLVCCRAQVHWDAVHKATNTRILTHTVLVQSPARRNREPEARHQSELGMSTK